MTEPLRRVTRDYVIDMISARKRNDQQIFRMQLRSKDFRNSVEQRTIVRRQRRFHPVVIAVLAARILAVRRLGPRKMPMPDSEHGTGLPVFLSPFLRQPASG